MSKFKVGEKIMVHIEPIRTVEQIIESARNGTLNNLNLFPATVLEYHRFFGTFKGWYKVKLENGEIIYPLTMDMKKIRREK